MGRPAAIGAGLRRPGAGMAGHLAWTCTIFGPRKGQRRPGRVDPLLSLERPDDDRSHVDSRRRCPDARPCPWASPAVGRRPARPPRPPTGGLYDPRFEHDACGVALVADLQGRPSHTLVRQAICALEHLAHRGATGSEEDSGDGAGILIQVPHDFYAEVGRVRPARPGAATPPASPSCPAIRRRGRRGPDGHRQAGRRGGPRGPRLARRALPRRHPGLDRRGGHALDAPAVRGPGPGHAR